MVPFTFLPQPGIPIYEQAVYAAKKAIISGKLRPGDAFPSVRELSKALKINPNTAHKVVAQLVAEALLEVRPGLGTFVAGRGVSNRAERTNLLKNELEQVVVEAKRLGLDLGEVSAALQEHWRRLDHPEAVARRKASASQCKRKT